MHANIVQPLACVTASFDGRGFTEHQSNGLSQLAKMFISLEPLGIFGSWASFAYIHVNIV